MFSRLPAIPNLQVIEGAPLNRYTRFGIGGPAQLLADAISEDALIGALAWISENKVPHAVIGGGTNLIADDSGFPGIVLRYPASSVEIDASTVRVKAGTVLQDLVDQTVDHGLQGLETMTGIPGWVGGAIYGNAGAYGHSISELVETVRFFDGCAVREIGNRDCEFRYRESVFKGHKDWIILSTTLRLDPADSSELRATSDRILTIRNQKYPPTMRCAGSIFKNLLLAELPESLAEQVPERVIREGKVPSAYFLELAGAKGMSIGAIRVADYHANLIYNEGNGTALALRQIIVELKSRVCDRFGILLEEEVQYVTSLRS
jgi:UDP-N-acetylmuramate dehydrogenase